MLPNVGLWPISLQKSLRSGLDPFPGKGVSLEWPRRHPKAFGIHRTYRRRPVRAPPASTRSIRGQEKHADVS